MKYAALAFIAVLALFGGLAITYIARREMSRRRVNKKLMSLKPCDCGSKVVEIHTDEHTLIVCCEECGKIVRGPIDEAIKEWNMRNEVTDDE